jgi:hypothetical protein
MNNLKRLQDWYNAQCDGRWEHQHGIAIDTLDNPGWSVTIDLQGSNLESATMSPLVQDKGKHDWIHCKIDDGKFLGDGDPLKLETILDIFLMLLPHSSVSN